MASNTPEFPGPQWGDTVEIPARKRRRINKYQGFLLEEKEFLMKCEHLESRTKKILKASHEKLSSFVSQQNLPDEIKYLNSNIKSSGVDHWLTPENWKLQQNSLETFVMKAINELEKEVENCFAQIEQPLKDGIEVAKASHQNIINGILNRTGGKRGYHRTLKALCLKNGMYASQTFARLDINDALAQPIYKKINPIFGTTFRNQTGTQATLKGILETFRCFVQKKFKEDGKKSSWLNCLVQERLDV
ncbi:hypothetical protein Y1Q_0011400 [Alligator mississippiensis]|uniref:Uncharacterized protein n=1 Tax=Alligator mississippiensis TaxID=8496 RepID=A0A151P4Z8_ALLMI|nr:hypothetical protein Y1Q_0011400 [Alligator mississippiensis]